MTCTKHRMFNRSNIVFTISAAAGWVLFSCAVTLVFVMPAYAEDDVTAKRPEDATIGEPMQIPEDEKEMYRPVIRYDADGNPIDPCRKFDAEYDSWIDRSQVGLFRTVCNTGAFFDGFFGDSRFDEKTGETYGRFSSGFFYDRRDSFDPVIRLRAKFALAAARNRTSFFIRSGEENNVVEERGGETSEQAVEALSRDEDTAIFAGFGFDQSENLERGFSVRAGLKFRAPIEQFVKARYRYGWRASDTLLLRLRPVVYWKSEEHFGATLGFQTDKFIGERFMLRWDNSANVTQDPEIEGVRWNSSLSLFHALSNSRAFTYSVFVDGETEDDVKLQDYGLEVKFRHRFLRDWLFLEYVGSVDWPREDREDDRDINPGAGIRFEAYFGEQQGRTLR